VLDIRVLNLLIHLQLEFIKVVFHFTLIINHRMQPRVFCLVHYTTLHCLWKQVEKTKIAHRCTSWRKKAEAALSLIESAGNRVWGLTLGRMNLPPMIQRISKGYGPLFLICNILLFAYLYGTILPRRVNAGFLKVILHCLY